MSATTLTKEMLLAASKLGARLFRNNTGVAWMPAGRGSNVIKIKRAGMFQCHPGDVIVRKARPVKFGLAVGSPDLVGWSPLEITEDMVGKTVAIFTGAELKTENDQPTKEQLNFNAVVREHGGRAGIVRSHDDLIALLRNYTL